MEITVYSILLFFASFLSFVLGAGVFFRNRQFHGFHFFVLTFVSVAHYNLFYGLEISCKELEKVIQIYKIEFFGIAYLSTFYLLFALQFTGFYRKIRIEHIIILMSIPTVSIFFNLTNEQHNYMYSNARMVETDPFYYITFEPGFWYRIQQIYDFLIMIFCFIIFGFKWKTSPKIFKKQISILALSLTIPFLFFFAPIFDILPYGLDLIPFASTLTLLFMYIGLSKYLLFDIVPIARGSVFEQIEDAIFIVDLEKRIIDINQSLILLFPWIENKISFDSLELFSNYKEIQEAILNNESNFSSFIKIIDKKSVRFFKIESNNLKNSDKNQILGRIIIIRDITDIKIAELKILEQNQLLIKSNSEKVQFFSILAHDLRSPFSGLVGLSKLMLEDFEDMEKEEIKSMIHTFNKTTTNLFELVDGLLAWSMLQSEGNELEVTELNFYDIFKISLKNLESSINNKKLTINFDMEENLNIVANSHMIASIIRNLLQNAIKFSPRNSTIYASAKISDSKIIFTVRDEGIGIPEHYIPNLFQLHVKTNQLGTEGERSIGLGLPLVKEFVDKHRGTISVTSQIDNGAIFTVMLPIDPD
jgi:signal transduction histidine kinase